MAEKTEAQLIDDAIASMRQKSETAPPDVQKQIAQAIDNLIKLRLGMGQAKPDLFSAPAKIPTYNPEPNAPQGHATPVAQQSPQAPKSSPWQIPKIPADYGKQGAGAPVPMPKYRLSDIEAPDMLKNIDRQLQESSGLYKGVRNADEYHPLSLENITKGLSRAKGAYDKLPYDPKNPLDKSFGVLDALFNINQSGAAPAQGAKPPTEGTTMLPPGTQFPGMDLGGAGAGGAGGTGAGGAPGAGMGGAGGGMGSYMDMVKKLMEAQQAQANAKASAYENLKPPTAPKLREDYESNMLPLLQNMPKPNEQALRGIATASPYGSWAKGDIGGGIDKLVAANKTFTDEQYGDKKDKFDMLSKYVTNLNNLSGTDFSNQNASYTNQLSNLLGIATEKNPTAPAKTGVEALKFLKEEQGKDARQAMAKQLQVGAQYDRDLESVYARIKTLEPVISTLQNDVNKQETGYSQEERDTLDQYMQLVREAQTIETARRAAMAGIDLSAGN